MQKQLQIYLPGKEKLVTVDGNQGTRFSLLRQTTYSNYKHCTGFIFNLPRIEKKIIKPADICTTLRLPTRVKAKRPAFSLTEIKQTPHRQESCLPKLK